MIARWKDDHIKHFSSRHFFTCCEAELEQRTLYKAKIIDSARFQELLQAEITKKNYFSIPHVTWRYYCTNCDKQNNGEYEFKRFRVP